MRTLLAGLCLAIILCPAGEARQITGTTYHLNSAGSLGRTHEQLVFCNDSANLYHGTYLTYLNGEYKFLMLPLGIYGLVMRAPRPEIVTGIDLTYVPDQVIDIIADHYYDLGGNTWMERWAREVGQDFIATGENITEAVFTLASDPTTLRASFHAGGPGGPQIGPYDYFSLGLISGRNYKYNTYPTIPGKRYYVQLRRQDNMLWSSWIRLDQPPGYPLGTIWYDGVPDPSTDLNMRLDGKNDGLNKDYSVGSGDWWTALRFGQQFRALGNDLACLFLHLGGEEGPINVIVTIRENGPGGAQVGVQKYIGANRDIETGIVYQPGQVPLVPGQIYYVEIEKQNGTQLTSYVARSGNPYPDGMCYLNNNPAPTWDLALGIYTREAPRIPINISNIQVSALSNTTATITWETDVDAMTQVEYWPEGGNITTHVWTELDETLAYSHQVTLSGLTHGTQYRYVVRSYRDTSHEYAVSGENTFTTTAVLGSISGTVCDEAGAGIPGAKVEAYPGPETATSGAGGAYSIPDANVGEVVAVASADLACPQTVYDLSLAESEALEVNFGLRREENLLANPGFESMLDGWTIFGEFDGSLQSGVYDVPAHSGNRYAGAISSYDTKIGGIWQQVAATPGHVYRAEVYVYTCSLDGGSTKTDSRCSIGIDPYGGTDPDASTVVWAPYRAPRSYWTLVSVEAEAQAPTVTVFLRHTEHYAFEWNKGAFDDAALVDTSRYYTTPVGLMQAGWNLISIPLQPEDPSVADVLAGLVGVGNAIENALYRYVPGAGYELYPGDFTTMAPGVGYWLKLTQPATVTFEGTPPEGEQVLPLAEGWNLIGPPVPETVPISSLQVDTPGGRMSFEEAVAGGYIQPQMYYYEGGYKIAAPSGGDSDSLEPARGYWAKTYTSGVSLVFP